MTMVLKSFCSRPFSYTFYFSKINYLINYFLEGLVFFEPTVFTWSYMKNLLPLLCVFSCVFLNVKISLSVTIKSFIKIPFRRTTIYIHNLRFSSTWNNGSSFSVATTCSYNRFLQLSSVHWEVPLCLYMCVCVFYKKLQIQLIMYKLCIIDTICILFINIAYPTNMTLEFFNLKIIIVWLVLSIWWKFDWLYIYLHMTINILLLT